MAELVTVVVPARNEERHLPAALASIAAQDHEELEVLVVVGPSGDRTLDIARTAAERDPRFRIVHNPPGRIPTALNAGLAEARGEWLVRVDAHSTVPPHYVRTLVEHLRTGRWGGVGGRKDAVAGTAQGRAIAAALGSRFGVGDSAYHYAERPTTAEHVPFGAYPVALLRAIGGWDEGLDANEDFELDHRLRAEGYELLLDPSVRIAWCSRETIRELFAQYRRYGRGKAGVAFRHPESVRLRHLAPPALVAGLTGAAAIARWRPSLAAGVIAPYALAVAAGSAAVARREEDAAVRRSLPAAFVAMHVGWGLGFWEGLAREAVRAARERRTGGAPVTRTSIPSRRDSRAAEDRGRSLARDPRAA